MEQTRSPKPHPPPKIFTFQAEGSKASTSVKGLKYGEVLKLGPGTLTDEDGSTMTSKQGNVIVVGPGATYVADGVVKKYKLLSGR